MKTTSTTTTTTTTIPRCRRCGRRHRSWRALAKCRWPGAHWVGGEGPFASVSSCRPGDSVELYATRQQAERARARIDEWGCCGGCTLLHRVVDLAGGRRG